MLSVIMGILAGIMGIAWICCVVTGTYSAITNPNRSAYRPDALGRKM